MRVCFVSRSADLVGAERALLELILALRMRHVESFVILPGKGPLLDWLMRLGVRCTIVRYYPWMGSTRALWKRLGALFLGVIAAVQVIGRVHSWKVDLVCTNSIVVFTGALAAWLARKPHVWFIHEFVDEKYGLLPYLPLPLVMGFLNARSRLIIVNSDTVRRGYARYLPEQKMHVAYQAVLCESPPSSASCVPFKWNAGPRCASIGALLPGKGHSDAIRAIETLSNRGFVAQLAIVGSGPDRAFLEALVEASGLQERVYFTGFLPNLFPLMEASDAILVCSREEAFCRVVVEAMKTGKPVIAAASEATLELIRDGFNGLLYRPGDHEHLAERLLLLLQSPSLQEKVKKNGLFWAQCFSLESYGAAVLRQFSRILQGELSGGR